jgi:hypothetical protein
MTLGCCRIRVQEFYGVADSGLSINLLEKAPPITPSQCKPAIGDSLSHVQTCRALITATNRGTIFEPNQMPNANMRVSIEKQKLYAQEYASDGTQPVLR